MLRSPVGHQTEGNMTALFLWCRLPASLKRLKAPCASSTLSKTNLQRLQHIAGLSEQGIHHTLPKTELEVAIQSGCAHPQRPTCVGYTSLHHQGAICVPHPIDRSRWDAEMGHAEHPPCQQQEHERKRRSVDQISGKSWWCEEPMLVTRHLGRDVPRESLGYEAERSSKCTGEPWQVKCSKRVERSSTNE